MMYLRRYFVALVSLASLSMAGACSSSDGAQPAEGSSTGGVSGSSGAVGGNASVGGTATQSSGGAKSTGGATSTPTSSVAGTGGSTSTSSLGLFSFFVASQEAMVRLSGSANGFGGDLRYGMADGLSGADKICAEIAEASMPGSGAKGWRAFLSVTAGPSGSPVNAIDRVGAGPWYDRVGRLVAANKTDLLNPRPVGANAAIANDLPNETGTPNHGASGAQVDNHDTLTGTDAAGGIGATTRANTCNDWTSVAATGKPQTGHSWPRGVNNAVNWYSEHSAPGCAAGANTGSQNGSGSCVGCSGGYGGIYCFALVP